MRRVVVVVSLLLGLVVSCAPAGNVSLHDVVLVRDSGSTRLQYVYGSADSVRIDDVVYELSGLVADGSFEVPYLVVSARQVNDQPYLKRDVEATIDAPVSVVRIPLTTDLELRTSIPIERVVYFDGNRWFLLGRGVEANVTRRVTPTPTSTPLRGMAALSPAEADAIQLAISEQGEAVVLAAPDYSVQGDAAALPTGLAPSDPGNLEEYLHTLIYVQNAIDVDPASYRAPGERALYETVASGSQGVAPEEDRFFILDDGDALRAFWNQVHATMLTVPPTPEARFEAETLFAIQLSSRPSSGYGIDVRSVERRDGELFVDVVLTEPAEGAITSTVLTSPWTLVRVLGIDASVVWFRNPEDGTLFAVATNADAPF